MQKREEKGQDEKDKTIRRRDEGGEIRNKGRREGHDISCDTGTHTKRTQGLARFKKFCTLM